MKAKGITKGKMGKAAARSRQREAREYTPLGNDAKL